MKVLASYSIKGGVGKTALSVNLAYAFQQSGKRTLLVDLDPQGAAGFYFRVSPAEKFKAKNDDLSEAQLKSDIRESDYPGLDILPSNLAYRKFDLLLDRMKKRRSQLRFLFEAFEEDYDRVILDCPPNITLLSENVFRASDRLLVPLIPTTLSERTLEQLLEFFTEKELPVEIILPLFSMAQKRNRMHQENIETLPKRYPAFLKTVIPFTVEVEKMGLHRKPLLAYANTLPVSAAYWALFEEIEAKMHS
ncbi:MAG TPA: AAA family ATPase [Terrimicrobiaceae bacterium]